MPSSIAPAVQHQLKQFYQHGLDQGCPRDQLLNFVRAGLILQSRQLAASAAARRCDRPDGPAALGYGGARGGGKTHWLLAQMGADDCQRQPGLKCLLLRKVGKANREHFEDLRQRLFAQLPHEFNASRGLLTFPNGSRIVLGHYQCEKDIDAYLGLEYDVIGIEEATQLTQRKYEDISTCCRTSTPNWRPRLYSTTNPGGIGHQWYFDKFIAPHQAGTASATRFIPARVDDNAFINAEYRAQLASRTGWQYDAWYLGHWNFAAGQFFRNFHPGVHVIAAERAEPAGLALAVPSPAAAVPESAGQTVEDSQRREFLEALTRRRRFRESDAVEWFAAMDYGYTHLTAVLLGCRDHEGNLYILDEHAARHGIPQAHAQAIKAMLARHRIYVNQAHLREALLAEFPDHCTQREQLWHSRQQRLLARFVAGADMFGAESSGQSVATQYRDLGLSMRPADMDRVSGWSVILERLGDPAAGILPTLFIHERCRQLLTCLPQLQHDPDRPGDVLKTNLNEDGVGGDDLADCLRYLVATRPREIIQRKLRGW
jgi:phage terminase large subunit